MADQQSNETIRQMMAGFSAMQFNLGIVPMPQAQAMAGAPAPFQTPPPPPQVPHPSEAAAAAMASQQAMMQQSLQIAQATRYAPPPSAPTPSLGAMSAYAPMSSPVGGGGFMGGGRPGMGGIPGLGGGFSPAAMSMPSIFNPLAPAMPGGHFMSSGMQHLQMQQHAQSQMMGMAAGVGSGAIGMGGSLLGGALGSFFGPLGTAAGSWLGGKVGGAVASTIFNPVTQDFARGRQIQQMTSPFMVSGSNLNTATGQGFSQQAGRDIASGVRHLQRDYDFERTGFNSQDAMRIMSMSAEQGLLTGTQAPDQVVQRVKDISKTVKMLMKITGDPDVRDAIQSLGQMRGMGFQGLAAQAGAVANRAVFARMAGQSQAQMTATMMGGAEMAGQFGLVGATGASAAMYGAGAANVAASSGAVNEIGLARAGGVQGLGRLNTAASLSAMQNDQYLLAAMGRDAKGHMTVDMDRYRANQGRSFEEVQRMAADSLRNMDTKGIFEWNSKKQELKDQIAQQMRPGEMQQMMLAQARQLQRAVPTMNLGTALQQTTGLGAAEAGVLEHQLTSRKYWEGLAQQNRVQRAEVAEHERAQREGYRTPGLMTRAGQGIRGGLGAASDFISSPFRSFSERLDRVGEEKAATEAGERISRYGEADIAHDEGERKMLRASLARGGGPRGGRNFVGRAGTGGFFDEEGALSRSAGRQINRMGSFLGLSSEDNANKLAAIADYSSGRYTSLGETFGDPRDALARVKDVSGVGRAFGMAPISSAQIGTMYQSITDAGGTSGKKFNAGAILGATTQGVVSSLKDMKAGLVKSARAFAESDFKKVYIEKATGVGGMTQSQAERSWEKNKSQVMNSVIEEVRASGDKSLIEPLSKAAETSARAGAVDLSTSTEAAEAAISEKLKRSGMGDLNDKTMQEVKSVLGNHDNDVIAMATSIRAKTSGNKEEQAAAARVDAEMHTKLGDKAYEAKKREAMTLAGSLSGDTADAFERTFRGTENVADINKKLGFRLDQAREAGGDTMALAAQKEFKQGLEKYHKGAAGARTVEEAVAGIQENELDNMPDSLKDAILKFQKTGDKTLLNKEIDKAGPTSRTTRHSDAASSALDQMDKDYQRLKDEADKAEDQGGDDTSDPSQTMFRDSVRLFADSVKVLSGHGEKTELSNANPAVQSMMNFWGIKPGDGS